jgi:hypothetical protein
MEQRVSSELELPLTLIEVEHADTAVSVGFLPGGDLLVGGTGTLNSVAPLGGSVPWVARIDPEGEVSLQELEGLPFLVGTGYALVAPAESGGYFEIANSDQPGTAGFNCQGAARLAKRDPDGKKEWEFLLDPAIGGWSVVSATSLPDGTNLAAGCGWDTLPRGADKLRTFATLWRLAGDGELDWTRELTSQEDSEVTVGMARGADRVMLMTEHRWTSYPELKASLRAVDLYGEDLWTVELKQPSVERWVDFGAAPNGAPFALGEQPGGAGFGFLLVQLDWDGQVEFTTARFGYWPPAAAAAANDGGVLVAGYTGFSTNEGASFAAYLVRLSPEGEELWRQVFLCDEDCEFQDVAASEDGQVAAVGSRYRDGIETAWVVRFGPEQN